MEKQFNKVQFALLAIATFSYAIVFLIDESGIFSLALTYISYLSLIALAVSFIVLSKSPPVFKFLLSAALVVFLGSKALDILHLPGANLLTLIFGGQIIILLVVHFFITKPLKLSNGIVYFFGLGLLLYYINTEMRYFPRFYAREIALFLIIGLLAPVVLRFRK